MSDNLNIRYFRIAGQSDEADAGKKGNQALYSCLIAIVALSVVGCKPDIELHQKTVEAASAGQTQAHEILPETVKDNFLNKDLTSSQYLNLVDAKPQLFDPVDMELLKYKRVLWALKTCDFKEAEQEYIFDNLKKHRWLNHREYEIKEQRRVARGAGQQGSRWSNREAKITVDNQASNRDVEKTNLREKQLVIRHRPKFNDTDCRKIRTMVLSGTMALKEHVGR